jgi:hypothetical protein
MLSIGFGSRPVLSRRLAVQTRRRVELLVLPVPLTLGPRFVESIGGEQQLSEVGENASQNPYRDKNIHRKVPIIPIPIIPRIRSILGIPELFELPELSGLIRQLPHSYRLLPGPA